MGIGRYQTPAARTHLTLNVVTPENSHQPLPVMVFIHSGGLRHKKLSNPDIRRRSVGTPRLRVRVGLTGWGALGCVTHRPCRHHQITLDNSVYLRDLVLARCVGSTTASRSSAVAQAAHHHFRRTRARITATR